MLSTAKSKRESSSPTVQNPLKRSFADHGAVSISLCSSADSMAFITMTMRKAAFKLFRFWKCCRQRALRHLIANFVELGITSENLKSISFSQLKVLLRKKPVVYATKQLLQRLHYMTVSLHGRPSNAPVLQPSGHAPSVNCSTFLAMYMIVVRPAHVFEDFNPLALALLDASRLLMQCFEDIRRQFLARGCNFLNVDADLRSTFGFKLFCYLEKFEAWKVPDQAKIRCRIKHALMALQMAEGQISIDGPVDSGLRIELQTQIALLRGKLQQIGGLEALQEFDKNSALGRKSLADQVDATVPNIRSFQCSQKLTKEQFAHELLIDSSFQLPYDDNIDLYDTRNRIVACFRIAFWDSLADDMRLEPPCYVRVLRVLQEIRDGIAKINGEGTKLQIYSVIDLELIQSRVRADALHWDEIIALVFNAVKIIRQVQSPACDVETGKKWDEVRQLMESATETSDRPGAFCKSLEFLLDRTNALRTVAVNTRLRRIAPVIRDHGIGYEKGRFMARLNSGAYTVENVKRWISDAVGQEISKGSVDIESLRGGSSVGFETVLRGGYFSLILNSKTSDSVKPETFIMDQCKFIWMIEELECLSAMNSMLIGLFCVTAERLTTQERTSDGYDQHRQVCVTQSIHIAEAVGLKIKNHCRFQLNKEFESFVRAELSQTSLGDVVQDEIVEAVSKYGRVGHAVHNLFQTRTLNIWKRRFEKSQFGEKDVAEFKFGQNLMPRITRSADLARRIFDISLLVHGDLYNRLIREAVLSMTVS